MLECDMYFDGALAGSRDPEKHISRSTDLSVQQSVHFIGIGHIYKYVLFCCNNFQKANLLSFPL